MGKTDERNSNICSVLEDNLSAGRGDNIAIYCGEEKYTYAQLVEQMNRMGNAFKRLDVQLDTRILMVLLDSPAFPISFFGAVKIGAVPIPVNTMLRPKDYEYFLQDSGAEVIVVDQMVYHLIQPIRISCKDLKHIMVVNSADNPGTISWDECLMAESSELHAQQRNEQDMAFWLYSSGSTGNPKGVVHLQRNMPFSNKHYGQGILQITQEDVCFSSAKLFHAYGLGNNMSFPYSQGASTVLLYPNLVLPEIIFEHIEHYEPTIFFSTPGTYAGMLEFARKGKGYNLNSVRLCISAGEALPAKVYREWKEYTKKELLDGVGSTELLHIIISNTAGKVKAGSSGQVVPGYQAKIVDEGGNEVPCGQVGDLLVRGKSAASCYWNQPEQTNAKLSGDWVFTGDKYCQDKDGYYWYQGRSDDMFKVNGIWISPIDVENCLMSHPKVKECVVVGTEEEGLMQAKAFVLLNEGEQESDELSKSLKIFVKYYLPQKNLRSIVFVKELSRTATGKIQRYKLRDEEI
ncbi:MAG: benzoate-CoA ligase family protein [Planctomycetes bacterium]|nr:benzoate-CoA ligase family protein [Planctomycetota bacterium]